MIKSEESVAKILIKKGFKVLHRGWPDFLCINKKTERCYALEVKSGKDKVKPHQVKMHAALEDCGLPVYVTYGKDNLYHRGRKVFSETTRNQLQKRVDAIVLENRQLRNQIAELERKLGKKYIRTPNGVLIRDFKDDFEGVLNIESNDRNNVIDITKRSQFGTPTNRRSQL